jgi:signal transduction histidine kinase
LHDDIGASLSRVAILSEVVKQQVGPEQQEPNRRLSEIAETARALVEAMSDIVWSIDSRRDDLHSVIVRVRDFASDVLVGNSIAWELCGTEEVEMVKLNPEQRRNLYLVFKEALTNIARHSGSTSVSLAIRVGQGRFCAEIRDNGRGFDPASTHGHGLENMHARVAKLGGEFRVDSAGGDGTRLVITVPV